MNLRLAAALALLPALSGCVAVAALPVLAGGAMVAGGNVKIRAATPRPKPTKPARLATVRTAGAPVATTPGLFSPAIVGGSGVETPAPMPEPTPQAAMPLPSLAVPANATGVQLTTLRDLPAPTPAAPDPWQGLVAWTGRQAAELGTPGRHRSALFEAGSSLALPRQRECDAKIPAVLVDLDPGTRPFDPAAASQPAPGLAAALAKLREAGVAILWISEASAARVGDIAAALSASGLDPEGGDPLLLVRRAGDRKQALRDEANRDVCVVAIAGDRKSDFDELFDYLRDPDAAQALDTYLGAGWFVTPTPLG